MTLIILFLPMRPDNLHTSVLRDQLLRKQHKLGLRHQSQQDLGIGIYGMWQAKSSEEEKIFRAVRNSELFEPTRMETFVKFNYRTA